MAKREPKVTLKDLLLIIPAFGIFILTVKIQQFYSIPASLFGTATLSVMFLATLFFRYRQLHPFMRNGLALMSSGFCVLTISECINDYWYHIYQWSWLYPLLALLPGYLY